MLARNQIKKKPNPYQRHSLSKDYTTHFCIFQSSSTERGNILNNSFLTA